MVGVTFFFEDVIKNISSGLIEASLERIMYNLKFLGATDVIMIDVTTYHIGQYFKNVDSEINFHRKESLLEVEKQWIDVDFVYLENKKSLGTVGVGYANLSDFEHSDNVIYVAGADSGSENIVTTRKDKTWVCIEAISDMWAELALAICLYDRKIKGV